MMAVLNFVQMAIWLGLEIDNYGRVAKYFGIITLGGAEEIVDFEEKLVNTVVLVFFHVINFEMEINNTRKLRNKLIFSHRTLIIYFLNYFLAMII